MAKKKIEMTDTILSLFEEISAVPRPSKHEDQICAWLLEWASKHGFAAQQDPTGNILIKVPGKNGGENAAPVVIQGHVDMVCEKTPESTHDFSKDPITFVHDGEWLRAKDTSLGADNGIAIAIALAAALEPKLAHPPLELLFTVDEESGLTGAKGLHASFFEGHTLINLDSEDEGIFTVGCAGGMDTHLHMPLTWDEVTENYRAFKLRAEGMSGGHSGVNIHEERANAIRVLVRTLISLRGKSSLQLVGITGGSAHNAIPRFAEAVFFAPENDADDLYRIVDEAHRMYHEEFKKTDPTLAISMEAFYGIQDRRAMTLEDSDQAIDFLIALPHGVACHSVEVPGLVDTSNNLAVVRITEGHLEVLTSQRSLSAPRLAAMTWRIEAIGRLAGARVESGTGYPPWQPDLSSPLLAKSMAIYKKLFKKDAKVECIHAGLECGLIGAIKPGMDMVSFGCTLKDPHSPSERLFIPSIQKIWDLLAGLLKELC